MTDNKQFTTRAYNSIEHAPYGLIKKSSTSERLSDEAAYYDQIPKNVAFLFPRKIDYQNKNNTHNLILEYYPYKTLGEYMVSGETTAWDDVFSNLKGALELMSGHVKITDQIRSYGTAMYIEKTYNEYVNLKKTYYDKELFSCPKLVINDIECDNFELIWDNTKKVIQNNLLNFEFKMIHGDMCFSNILYHPKVGARFIDMRGSFGEKGIYGDVLYDYAKLLHSVEGGYEFFINDLFNVSKEAKGIYNFFFQGHYNKKQAFDSYMKAFSDQNIHLIRLVQGLIFVGMCARHYDCEKRQMAMYLTGIKSLNEALKALC